MSEPKDVQTTAVAPAAPAPAPKLNAIQIIEQEIASFFKQKEVAAKQYEQALANVHAIEGAIQASQRLIAVLRAEAAKAEAEATKLATDVDQAGRTVEQKVVSIADAIKKEL